MRGEGGGGRGAGKIFLQFLYVLYCLSLSGVRLSHLSNVVFYGLELQKESLFLRGKGDISRICGRLMG